MYFLWFCGWRLGTAKGVDVDVEDVWFLCAQLSNEELDVLAASMTRAGALRWDFQARSEMS